MSLKKICAVMAATFSAGLAGCEKPNYCDGDLAEISAYTMSQTFVKRQLRSPSTASFESYSSPETVVYKTPSEPCTFKVRGAVDSQNGFGATVRSIYHAEIKPTDESGQTYELVSFTMQQQ